MVKEAACAGATLHFLGALSLCLPLCKVFWTCVFSLNSVVLVASCVQLFATSQTVTCQAPVSMEFSRREYRSGLPFPSPEDLRNLGIEPGSPVLQAVSLPSELQGSPKVIK